MLLSMTGYGDARRTTESLIVIAEVRAVNNRYFKFSCRTPEGFGVLEGDVEKAVRGRIARGTVTVGIRLERTSVEDQYAVNPDVLRSYWKQLDALAEQLHAPPPSDVGSLLQLPGAVAERQFLSDPHALWPDVAECLQEALARLQDFRRTEGKSMHDGLLAQCRAVQSDLDRIAAKAPDVARDYRDKLSERLKELLAEHDVEFAESDLLREVSLFADRCDINEEITRLRSHLEQFEAVADEDASQGRKLEFLCQEMFREVNTIGSKANNVEIAHYVVDMKAAVEKMREILQNVE